MSVFKAPIRFFLGSHTPSGFTHTADTLYEQRDGWRVYLLKSGAGTGKSSLLRRVFTQLYTAEDEGEVFCCSSDPSSLDAVRFEKQRICVLDATAPHSLEPAYWGAVEEPVPLSVCMDTAALRKQADTVIALTDENRALHKHCCNCLRAAANLLTESRRMEQACVDRDKVCHFARRLAITECGTGTTPDGTLKRRFLSALTPEGWLTFDDTVQALCPRIYAVEDEQGAVAALLLSELQEHALRRGLRCVSCPSPLFAGVENLLLPEIGVGFMTSHLFHKVDFPVYRRVHVTRFLDMEQFRRYRQRLCFHRRAATELISDAATFSAKAKGVHDRLEAISSTAMNWELYEQLTANFLNRL